MKIFFVDPQSYNNLAVYDSSLLTNMEGVCVTYFCNELYQCPEVPGVTHRAVFRYSRCGNALTKALSYSASVGRIAVAALRQRPDAVHIQWFRLWLLDYLLVFFFRLLGIRVVYTAHNVLPHTVRRGDKFRYVRYYHAVNAIIVHAQRTKEELVRMSGVAPDKVNVIRHGVLLSASDRTLVGQRTEQLRQALGIQPGTVVFSCLGIQNAYKGTDLVVDVWSRSSVLQSSDCFLLVVGKNENIDFSPLDGLKNVAVINRKVSDEDFDAYMALSSVVLLPYRAISQSGVLFTAVQAGTPVMVSDVGGLPEILSAGKVGWNIGEASLESVGAMLEHLARHPEEIDAVASDKEAFTAVRQAYDWAVIARQTRQVYAQP